MRISFLVVNFVLLTSVVGCSTPNSTKTGGEVRAPSSNQSLITNENPKVKMAAGYPNFPDDPCFIATGLAAGNRWHKTGVMPDNAVLARFYRMCVYQMGANANNSISPQQMAEILIQSPDAG